MSYVVNERHLERKTKCLLTAHLIQMPKGAFNELYSPRLTAANLVLTGNNGLNMSPAEAFFFLFAGVKRPTP